MSRSSCGRSGSGDVFRFRQQAGGILNVPTYDALDCDTTNTVTICIQFLVAKPKNSTSFMLFFGPFVHDIDPVIGTILGVHLWWYGLSYSLGFLNANFFLGRHRYALGLSMTAIYDLSIMLAAGVLIGGRV